MTTTSKHTVMPNHILWLNCSTWEATFYFAFGLQANRYKISIHDFSWASLPSMRCLPKAECKLCPYSNELSVTKVIASDSMTPQAWVPVWLQLLHALFICFHIYSEVCVYSCSHCVCLFKPWHWRHYFGLKMDQDIWGCSHDRDDVLTCLSPKKNYSDIIWHSLLSSIFPA